MSDALALLPPDIRALVQSGDYAFAPEDKWRDPLKPVVLNKGRIVHGSYAAAGAVAAENSRNSAWKRTSSYREAWEGAFPHGLDAAEASGRRMTFEGVIDLVYDAITGSREVQVDCPHPDLCDQPEHTISVAVSDPDPKLLFQVVENLVGKAKETIDVNIAETRIEILMAVRDQPLGIFEMTPEEAALRQKTMMDEGIVDPTWYDPDDGEEE